MIVVLFLVGMIAASAAILVLEVLVVRYADEPLPLTRLARIKLNFILDCGSSAAKVRAKNAYLRIVLPGLAEAS